VLSIALGCCSVGIEWVRQESMTKEKHDKMTKNGLAVGFLLLAGSVAFADPQERVVTLPGTASAIGATWEPTLLVREQKSGDGNRPVLYVHGFTFPSSLSVFWKLDGRSWADALNEAGFSVWGFDFAGYGGSERYPEMEAASPRPGPPLGAPKDTAEQIARVVSYILAQTKAVRISIVARTIPVGLFATQHPEQIERLVFLGLPRNASSSACRTDCRPPPPTCRSGVL
jgi:pimeloyl-ACP methyl ester carboxylesterase